MSTFWNWLMMLGAFLALSAVVLIMGSVCNE